MRWTCNLVLLFIFCSSIQAQKSYDFSLEYNRAFVFKHKPGLAFEIPHYSQYVGLEYRKMFRDSIGWENYWGYPHFITSIGWTYFGDNEVLGNAYAIIPGIQFHVLDDDFFNIKFNLSSGIAYIDKLYHPINNTTNNAISSHLNNNTKLSFDFRLKSVDWVALTLGLSHFSNGKRKLPNSGINYFHLGLKYVFSRVKEDRTEKRSGYNSLKKYGFDVYYGCGAATSENIGGPRYEINIMGLMGYYRFSDFFNVFLGGEREFHGPSYYYYLRDFVEEEEAKDRSVKCIVTTGWEMIFGHFSTKYIIGTYIPKEGVVNNEAVFFRLQTSYYPLGYEKKISPYLGVALKSHFGVADYISLQLGFKW